MCVAVFVARGDGVGANAQVTMVDGAVAVAVVVVM